MKKKRNAVFWKDGRYRGVILEGVYYPYIPLQLFITDRTATSKEDYPTKEKMLADYPHYHDFEQVEVE